MTFGCNFVPLREVKASRGKVISDQDLELLLDRSDLLGEETHHSFRFQGGLAEEQIAGQQSF